jgi:hypothetical protein
MYVHWLIWIAALWATPLRVRCRSVQKPVGTGVRKL